MPLSFRQRALRPGIWIGLILLLVIPTRARAQYFGQNKVQYDGFDFKVLATPHFDILYYSSEAEAAEQVARMAERWYTRLGNVLAHELQGRQAVVLYGSHPEFEQTNVIEGAIDEATGGVTEGQRRRVVLPLAATLGETDHVLGHELVHAFQYDILGKNAGGVPLWFIEGMAEYLSLGPRSPQTAMWLRDAAIEGTLPTVRQLDDPHFFPYRFGHAFWAYIGARYGDRMIGDILKSVAIPGGGALDPIEVIESSTGVKEEVLSTEWHRSIRALYDITPRERPSDRAERKLQPGEPLVIGPRTGSGSLNVGPSLSPDGRQVAFLSERGRLAIDLYVADTTTGKVTHTLTKTAVDPHFQSLQFLQSAGSWSPDGKRLAVATVRDGRGRLTVFDVDSERVDREVALDERGEIFQPAWSPDGTKLAYAAQIGGLSDLFVYDLGTSTTKRLTNDAYADLQPSWSSDGRRLVFTTDRVTSNVKTLAFGAYRLAALDVATGAITPIETGLSGNVVNPQWSSDGQALYFISDDSGRPDVYRADATGARPQVVASAPTGISGITPLSPALSIASAAPRGAYTVFRASAYEIEFLDLTSPSAEASAGPRPTQDLAVLATFPADRVSLVAQELERPADPDDAAKNFATKTYSPKLSLLAAGQQLGASTGGAFGTYVSGGVSLLFSDVLGNHMLGTSFGINGGAKDIAADASYLNRTHRWNWGVFGEHVPLASGSVQASTGISNGRPVYVEATDLYRQTYSTGGALLAYPLSRATRIEFDTSISRIGFDHEVQTQTYDLNTGAFLGKNTVQLDADPAITMFDAGAAIVRDTTASGPVSPILGQRFRFEVAPTFGDLQFVNTTADFRQYLMPVRPLVLAGRAMHIARYGAGSEDQRLMPLFLGYPSLVRGYDASTFDASECSITLLGTCPEFDRLEGSRMVVLNAEARMPLFGFGGNLDYGPVPTELFGFFDAGVAWTQTTTPSFAGSGDRDWVKSVGVGARVNALGFAILEFNLVRPIDRPQRGWMFVFNLRPGF